VNVLASLNSLGHNVTKKGAGKYASTCPICRGPLTVRITPGGELPRCGGLRRCSLVDISSALKEKA